MFTARRLVKTFASSSLLLCVISTAHAGAYCDGKVSDVHVRRSGDVSVFSAARNSYVDICNLNTNRGEATPAACRGWLALLVSASAQQRDVSLFYESYNACSEVPANASAPTPFQLMVKQ